MCRNVKSLLTYVKVVNWDWPTLDIKMNMLATLMIFLLYVN